MVPRRSVKDGSAKYQCIWAGLIRSDWTAVIEIDLLLGGERASELHFAAQNAMIRALNLRVHVGNVSIETSVAVSVRISSCCVRRRRYCAVDENAS